MHLKEHYVKNALPHLQEKLGCKNRHAIPRLLKVVVNVGLGNVVRDDSTRNKTKESLEQITGQKPAITRARNSIAGFNIREGLIVGNKITLRGTRMYDFITKVIHVVLPRVRDFQGLAPSSLDTSGNLTIGFKENTIFPEIPPEQSSVPHGLEVTCVTSAKTREEAFELFKALQFPFKKE